MFPSCKEMLAFLPAFTITAINPKYIAAPFYFISFIRFRDSRQFGGVFRQARLKLEKPLIHASFNDTGSCNGTLNDGILEEI